MTNAMLERYVSTTGCVHIWCRDDHHTSIHRLYDVYSFEVIPIFGEIFARDRQSYEYLVESIRMFPAQVL